MTTYGTELHEPNRACQECGEPGHPARYHTFLDCLRCKHRNGRLTERDMASLFNYAQRGEAATFRDEKWVTAAIGQQTRERNRRNRLVGEVRRAG